MDEDKKTPIAPPNFEGEEMHMPEGSGAEVSNTSETKERLINAPIIILMVLILLAVLGGMYYWFTLMEEETVAPIVIPTTNDNEAVPVTENEGEAATTSPAVTTEIETDLSTTTENVDSEQGTTSIDTETEVSAGTE